VSDPSLLPRIDAGDLDLPRVAEATWDALQADNAVPYVFRYGGLLSRIEADEEQAPIVRPLTVDRLRHILARSAEWYSRSGKGKRQEAPALPPLHVVKDMLARPDPPLPVLARIVQAPVFGPDGRLCLTPGYHHEARVYVALAPGLTIQRVPEAPDAKVVQVAVTVLRELLTDFPFVGKAERANTLALILTPFVRDLVDGPVPLAIIEKPTPGTGATLLADIAMLPATGRHLAAMTEGRDEDEWRKRLTAKLIGSPVAVSIDNIRRRLDSSNLSAAITSTVWEDRVLGHSEIARVPVRCAWIATGNNPALSAEMTRRTFRIRLDARVERPWLRNGFRHHDLAGWAGEHRGELIWAALVLGQAWLKTGRPAGKAKLGMFESWAKVLGGILEVAGVPGFLENLTEFYDAADAEGAEVRAFLSAWWDKHRDAEMLAGPLFELATSDACPLDLDARTEQGRRVKFGKRRAELRDRRYDVGEGLSVMVTAAGQSRRAIVWKLTKCESGESLTARPVGNGSGESVSLVSLFPSAHVRTSQDSLDISGFLI
jgi:putative DNA primase/helicase